MLVLAPAACIMGGIALSAAFDTLTGSIKFAPSALPALSSLKQKVNIYEFEAWRQLDMLQESKNLLCMYFKLYKCVSCK